MRRNDTIYDIARDLRKTPRWCRELDYRCSCLIQTGDLGIIAIGLLFTAPVVTMFNWTVGLAMIYIIPAVAACAHYFLKSERLAKRMCRFVRVSHTSTYDQLEAEIVALESDPSKSLLRSCDMPSEHLLRAARNDSDLLIASARRVS